jgi:cell division protein ZapA
MRQLEVQIMGHGYLLGCPDGADARLLEAVEKVDTTMCKIRDSGKVRARDRIAVLTAVNMAFDAAEAAAVPVPAAAPVVALPTPQPKAATHTGELSPQALAKLAALRQRLDTVLGHDDRLI